MEGILTVGELRQQLADLDNDAAPVMIAVVKYPEEFHLRLRDGEVSWTDSTDVEVHPLEEGELHLITGILHLTTELADYDEQRHFAGG